MLSRVCLYLIIIGILLAFNGVVNAKILFNDDFEGDTVGSAPKNFENSNNPTNAAGFKIDITNDPEGKSGKVAHTFNYAIYVPKSADTSLLNGR